MIEGFERRGIFGPTKSWRMRSIMGGKCQARSWAACLGKAAADSFVEVERALRDGIAEPDCAMALTNRPCRCRPTHTEAQAQAVTAKAAASSVEATIAHLKLMIEKLQREPYGQLSERTAR